MKSTIRRIVFFVAVITMVFCLSGCSMFDFFSIENLLKPPRLTGENAKLQAAFEQTVGSDVSLFTPLAGEHRASYIIFDSNSDGNDEAIVFYSLNSNSSVVHMHLLSQNNGEWYSVYDVTGSGTDVYKVDFFNLDTNRNMEIGVIWTLDDSKRDKNFSVYKINSLEAEKENSVVSLATIQISDYAYCDVDGDTADELLYFYFDGKSENASVNARLIDFNSIDNTLVPLSEVALPFVFSSVKQILFDLEDNNMRFYIDFISSAGTYFTEVIVFSRESEALSIPLLNGRNVSSLSVRNTETFCDDFDNDGYYDIPLTLGYDESYAVGGTEGSEISLSFVQWYTYFGESFKSVGKYFINYFDGYSMKIDSVYDKFFIVYDVVNKVTQVCVKNTGDEKNIVFSVALNKKQDDTVSILPDGFLGVNDENRFNIVISATGESYSFSEAYIESLISDLKE